LYRQHTPKISKGKENSRAENTKNGNGFLGKLIAENTKHGAAKMTAPHL